MIPLCHNLAKWLKSLFIFLFFGLTTQEGVWESVMSQSVTQLQSHYKISHNEYGKIVHRPCSSCISSIQEMNENSIEFSLSTQTWRVIKSSQAKLLHIVYLSLFLKAQHCYTTVLIMVLTKTFLPLSTIIRANFRFFQQPRRLYSLLHQNFLQEELQKKQNKTSSLEDSLVIFLDHENIWDFVSAQLRKFYGQLPSNCSLFIKTGSLGAQRYKLEFNGLSQLVILFLLVFFLSSLCFTVTHMTS